MIDTFTLTGQLFDASGQALALELLRLTMSADRVVDETAKRVYGPPPEVMTDLNGNLCRVASRGLYGPVPAGSTGLTLVTAPGLVYTLVSHRVGRLDRITFPAGTAGAVLDLSTHAK